MRLLNRLSFFALTFGFACACALAQSFLGSIAGTVRDASGALIPEANLTLTEVATGIQRTTLSDSIGNYFFADLPPGTYTVTASKEGFRKVFSSELVLTAGQEARFDAVLAVGNVRQTVEVKAEAPTLNTENGQVSGELTNLELNTLPINTRSALGLAYLNADTYQGNGSSISLGGIRGTDTNFTIDGVSSNSAVWGGQVGPMNEESLDAVGEVKTLVSNNSAEFPSVGTMMIATKSGTNHWHGDAFDLEQNNWLNARDFFASSVRTAGPTQHDFGADIGGPVIIPGLYNGHNKTFFHFTFEGLYFPGEYAGNAEVPTPLMQQGNFSELLPSNGSTPAGPICAANPNDCVVIYDPTTGLPFAGNIIPNKRISQVALNFQSFGFVPPNIPNGFANGYNWTGIFPSASHDHRWVVRLDHQVSDKDSIAFRSSIRQIPEPLNFVASVPQFYYNQGRSTQNVFLGWTHSFRPTLLNEFRVGFSRDASNIADSHTDGAALAQQLGLTGIDLSTRAGLSGFPEVNFVNFSGWGFEIPTYFWRTQTWELLDNVTYIKGRHNLKAGMLFRKNQINITACCNSDFGSMSFDGFASGYDYSDFLLGLPHFSSLYTRTIPSTPKYNEIGAYFQDDFHVTPKLTLNLGLRYDFYPSPVDKNDLLYNFDLQTGDVVVASSKSLQYVSPLFAAAGVVSPLVIETASQAGFPPRTLLNNDTTNFAPRVAFAYRPFANNHTVVRGGWGIYNIRLSYTRETNFGGGPFISNEYFTNTITKGAPLFQFPDPFTGSPFVATQSVSPIVTDLRTPRNQQWNLTLEHEFPRGFVGSITYRGLKGTQIPYSGDINRPEPSPTTGPGTGENWFRYPNYYQVTLIQDGGVQNLNAMDVRVQRKFARGLNMTSAWTWAHNLTDATPDGEGADSPIQNPYDRAPEYANVNYMPRHRWVSYLIYDLPFGKGKQFASGISQGMNQLVGGWEVSATTVVATGNFLTASTLGSLDPSNTRWYGGRPNCVGNPYLSDRTINDWFNEAAFAVPSEGTFGNCANSSLQGPGLANVDFGLFKNFVFGERFRTQLRMTATNFLNTPHFGNPNTQIGSGMFGIITYDQGGKGDTLGAGPRVISVGLRFEF